MFFLKTKPIKAFISALEFPPVGGNSNGIPKDKIIQTSNHSGTYFNRILALKFAGWLDPNFEVWVFRTIDKITFGEYDEHLKAMTLLEQAKVKLDNHIKKIVKDQNEDAIVTVELFREIEKCKSHKSLASRNQSKAFKKGFYSN